MNLTISYGEMVKMVYLNFHTGFPEKMNVEEFQAVCERTKSNDPDAMTRMAALFSNSEQVCHC